MFRKFLEDTRGATAVEYALVATLIATAVIASMQLAGTNVDKMYQQNAEKVGNELNP